MHKLLPPVLDDLATYDLITAAKESPRDNLMLACRGRISKAYSEYATVAPHVAGLGCFVATQAEHDALRHAFTVPTEPMSSLREVLTKPTKTVKCPYCGIGETGPLDHYLPKEKYPQFSTLSRNLVPICGNCNTYKRSLVIDGDTNVRLFLHPYYDEVPDQLFLSVNIVLFPTAIAIVFNVAQTQGMSFNLVTQLRAHFRILRLGERYTKNSINYLRELYPSIQRDFKSGGRTTVEQELAHKGGDFFRTYGANHWQSVLCNKLACTPAFCDGGFSLIESLP